MSAVSHAPILIVCGLPGAGKSTYATELERSGWARLSVDDVEAADPDLAAAWLSALRGHDEALVGLAARYTGVVIEWGFHTDDLLLLEGLVRRGYDAWYLDGDREAALAGWQEAHPDLPEHMWRDQVERLDQASSRILALFDGKIITTVGPGRTYVELATIHRRIGVI